MAIAVISSVEKTASGTLTIPTGCDYVYALVIGSEAAPKIGGMKMSKIISQPATTKVGAVAIYQFKVTATGTVDFVIKGESNSILYVSGSEDYRTGSLAGMASASFSGNLPTSASDLVLGVLFGMIGATALTGDSIAFTYIKNGTFKKSGYIFPADSSLACVASDSGVSTGYWIDGGAVYHPPELISEAYYSFDPVLHTVVWLYLYTDTPSGYKIYGKYDNGVDTGYRQWVAPGQSPPATTTYYVYVQTYHPAVYSEGWYEELPDIWVPGGEAASVNACFVSIQVTGGGEFVPRIIING